MVYKQAQEMLDKLPADYIPHEVKARLQKMGAIAPMNIFLKQEVDRMERVITLVRSTLKDLKLAIDGTIIMSEVSQSRGSHDTPALTPSSCIRTSEMPWTTSMMPKCPRYGAR